LNSIVSFEIVGIASVTKKAAGDLVYTAGFKQSAYQRRPARLTGPPRLISPPLPVFSRIA
jgi:hypothetical protein